MLYYLFHVLGFVGVVIYMLIWAPKYGEKRGHAIIHMSLTYASVYLLMMLLFYFVTGVFGGQNIVRIFMFVPPIALFYGKLMKIPAHTVLDRAAPIPCIVHGISHFGCIFEGCCYSVIKVDWGIYNPIVKEKLFPIQIFEALTAVVIVVVVILISKKKNYQAGGITMPWMLFLFGITRFAWEFLRDNKKLFWGISELALWALATAIVGAVWLIIAEYKKSKLLEQDSSNLEAST